jgi:hypothetical protein
MSRNEAGPASPKARRLVGKGIELVDADIEDPASLTRALDGVHGIYAVQTPYESGVEAETRRGINLIDAAIRSRITHFVYSSVLVLAGGREYPTLNASSASRNTFGIQGRGTQFCGRFSLWRTGLICERQSKGGALTPPTGSCHALANSRR